jgi:MOSC domain-containing protein YiiM
VSERNTIDFGVYATIVEPGRVRVGDSVEQV